LVNGIVNQNVVPAIVASLSNIAAEITNLTNAVKPLITDIILPLAEDEFNTLPGLVADTKAIVSDVQAAATAIINSDTARTLITSPFSHCRLPLSASPLFLEES
jgi:hypothetical protein